MKKILLVLILSFSLVFIVGASASAEVFIKGGVDLLGNVSMEYEDESASEDVEMGISFSMECLAEMADQLYIGGGFECQMRRKVDMVNGVKLNYLPIYGLVQYY